MQYLTICASQQKMNIAIQNVTVVYLGFFIQSRQTNQNQSMLFFLKNLCDLGLQMGYLKNPAYGRHQLSRPVRIVGSMPPPWAF